MGACGVWGSVGDAGISPAVPLALYFLIIWVCVLVGCVPLFQGLQGRGGVLALEKPLSPKMLALTVTRLDSGL